jgi:hypothetical protein
VTWAFTVSGKIKFGYLKLKLVSVIYENLFRTAKKTPHFSSANINCLILFSGTIPYSIQPAARVPDEPLEALPSGSVINQDHLFASFNTNMALHCPEDMKTIMIIKSSPATRHGGAWGTGGIAPTHFGRRH